jgi:hypothetical protein
MERYRLTAAEMASPEPADDDAAEVAVAAAAAAATQLPP